MLSTIHPIPAFANNNIWAASEQVGVVDPDDAQPVISHLEYNDLQLSYILITHHHPDHTGSVQDLMCRCSSRVLGPGSSGIRGGSEFVSEGNSISLFGQSFPVIGVPGHTLDHIAFYCEDEYQIDPIPFCSDTLFAAGCGRFFEDTPEMMHESLGKLSTLLANTRVYCTPESTMGNLQFAITADAKNNGLIERIELELATNRFLRCGVLKLQEITQARLGELPVMKLRYSPHFVSGIKRSNTPS